MRRVRATIIAVVAISLIYSECVPVTCSALQYFSTYLINGKIFEKKKRVIEHKMCVLSFSITFV